MLARDIMHGPVISVDRDTPVADIARLLIDKRISAVPVVDDNGDLAGIVSEEDLIHRERAGTEIGRPWWLRIFANDQVLADDYVKSHGMRAADVMTTEVISVPEDAPLLKIVELMAKNRIRRVVVRDGNRPVGMISRADVLRAVDEIEQTRQSTDRDREIRTLLLTELRKQPWFRLQDQDVSVAGGVVTYRGVVGTPSEQAALRVAAEAVPGVVRVMDLTLAESDTTLF